jgi:hypothetical protein
MSLILGDGRLDLGEFPDLMAEGLEINSGERFPAPATRFWRAGDDRGAVLDGH